MQKFTPEERAAICKFHAALAARCAETPEDKSCPACDMRIYCYMAPPSVSADQLELVMDCLENRAADQALACSLDRAFHSECNHRISSIQCAEEP